MICTECGSFLSYNSTYTEIECISCHKKIDFMTMKSKISKKEEMQMIDEYLNKSVQTSEPTIEIDDSEFVVEDNHQVEEVDEMISNQFESFNKEIENLNNYYIAKVKELKSLMGYYERKFGLIKSLIDIEKEESKDDTVQRATKR